MYFLIAANEEPFLSFKAPTAACTISEHEGWARGLAALLALEAFFAGDCGAAMFEAKRSHTVLHYITSEWEKI